MPSLASAALSLAESGWHVFPCSRSKVPLVKGWQSEAASCDPEQVAAMWREFPNANIGTPTGAIVVIDVDADKGGLETRRQTEAEGLEWPVTLTSLTGRVGAGAHFFYRAPGDVEIRNAVEVRNGRGIGPGVDVRGKGGLAILPPSVHPSGRRYRWLVEMEPAPLPLWMVERLRPRIYEPAAMPTDSHSTAYAQAALEGECQAVETAPDGTLNDTLNRASFKLGRFVAVGTLEEEAVSEALLVAATRNGHPERGARNTIHSGLRAGMRRAGMDR